MANKDSGDPNFPIGLDISPSEGYSATIQSDAIKSYGIAGRVWEASYMMNDYLESKLDFDPPFAATQIEKQVILELGSGIGAVAEKLLQTNVSPGDTVFATDLPEVCKLLESRLESWAHDPRLRIRSLAWGDEVHAQNIAIELAKTSLTHIVCCDLVYFPHLLAPLLRSLIRLTGAPFADPDNPPSITIAYKLRSLAKESAFWSAFGLWFQFSPVLARKSKAESFTTIGSTSGDVMFIFICKRKPESLNWRIPSSEVDLMGGVGALGTDARKSDDTFEMLLLNLVDV